MLTVIPIWDSAFLIASPTFSWVGVSSTAREKVRLLAPACYISALALATSPSGGAGYRLKSLWPSTPGASMVVA